MGGFGGRPLRREQGVRSCFRSRRLVGECLGVRRFVRSLVLVAFASVASLVYCRAVVRKNGTVAAASFVCLFVMLIVVIGLFIAGLTARLRGWLIRSAVHGMADNDDGHGDDAFGCVFWTTSRRACVCVAAHVGRLWRTSAWARAGRAFVFQILPLGWRVFGCWTVRPEPRVGGVRVGGVRVAVGRVGADGRGWVGEWAGCNAVRPWCNVVLLFARMRRRWRRLWFVCLLV